MIFSDRGLSAGAEMRWTRLNGSRNEFNKKHEILTTWRRIRVSAGLKKSFPDRLNDYPETFMPHEQAQKKMKPHFYSKLDSCDRGAGQEIYPCGRMAATFCYTHSMLFIENMSYLCLCQCHRTGDYSLVLGIYFLSRTPVTHNMNAGSAGIKENATQFLRKIKMLSNI